MDVSKLVKADEARVLEILDLYGKPFGLKFWVVSLDSRAARDASRKHADTLLASKEKALTGAIVEAEGRDKLAACVTKWEWGDNDWNGVKNPELTIELVKEVLDHLWINRQVETFATNLTNFTGAAAKG